MNYHILYVEVYERLYGYPLGDLVAICTEKCLILGVGYKYVLNFFAKLGCVILGDILFLMSSSHLQKGIANQCKLAGMS